MSRRRTKHGLHTLRQPSFHSAPQLGAEFFFAQRESDPKFVPLRAPRGSPQRRALRPFPSGHEVGSAVFESQKLGELEIVPPDCRHRPFSALTLAPRVGRCRRLLRLRRDRQHSRIAKSESAQAVKTPRRVIRVYGAIGRAFLLAGRRATRAAFAVLLVWVICVV
jgi:hypothetical protein